MLTRPAAAPVGVNLEYCHAASWVIDARMARRHPPGTGIGCAYGWLFTALSGRVNPGADEAEERPG